jgi:hypothetical protein
MSISLGPQHIDGHNWYYEYQGHILLIHEVLDKHGAVERTEEIKIPWRKLLRSLARRGKP